MSNFRGLRDRKIGSGILSSSAGPGGNRPVSLTTRLRRQRVESLTSKFENFWPNNYINQAQCGLVHHPFYVLITAICFDTVLVVWAELLTSIIA